MKGHEKKKKIEGIKECIEKLLFDMWKMLSHRNRIRDQRTGRVLVKKNYPFWIK